jgi:transcription-repair coupling factor (superfamily II helicase)
VKSINDIIISGLENSNSYKQLVKIIANNNTNTSRSLRFVKVAGIPSSIQSIFMKLLYKDFGNSIIYSERELPEIQRYAESISIFGIQQITHKTLINLLNNNNFKRVEKTDARGQFDIKGDLISFWPSCYNHPIRVSFFDEDIEYGYIYDEIYGKKYNDILEIAIGDESIFEQVQTKEFLHIYSPGELICKTMCVFSQTILPESNKFVFDINYANLYYNRLDILSLDIEHKINNGFEVIILSRNSENLDSNLTKYLLDDEKNSLDSGFISQELKLFVLTDREIFGTIFVSKAVNNLSSKKARRLLASLEGEIEIGDYIVHEDYGIGIYQGIKQEERKETISIDFGEYREIINKEDYILISYAKGDELYLPLSKIDKITKYISNGDENPQVTRLNKIEWAKTKQKVSAHIMILAKELVQHYAKRELAQSPKIDVDMNSDEYNKFLDKFPYQETTDQIRTEKEIVTDFANKKPMNRLIVGDVGFGKTEIAMRAAFFVAKAGYQVAVLCPTTVLAAQHGRVFSQRFADSNITVGVLSRFATDKINKQIIEELFEGKINIVVGTHRLLSSDVVFNKLGMLIIDEEQKFGVKQKEKIKKLEYGLHVLHMSATPIPRTLSMALSTIQDISIIQTPPEGRKAIKTIVEKISEEKIINAIQNEVSRGGQVYFLHNRVSTIRSKFIKLSKLMPDLKFAYAHGQMSSSELEKIINDFYEKKYDCLICTTIIENGIDMENVNTIIIEHAQNFGLGQLYQLRGRVGRGDKQAFAYMFYDGKDLDSTQEKDDFVKLSKNDKSIKKLKEKKYLQRLKAILEAQDLSSGFKLASRDLEIRGAGNLLGREQHGNISNIGYGLYMQMLAEEIEKQKNSDIYVN